MTDPGERENDAIAPSPAPSRSTLLVVARFVLCVLVIVLAVILIRGTIHHREEITHRAVCAANLNSIHRAISVYANDNDGMWPAAPFTPPPSGGGPNEHSVTFIGELSKRYDYAANKPPLETNQHPSRSLFLPVINGACMPKRFVCPGSGDQEDDLRLRYEDGRTHMSQVGVNRNDFRGYPYLSYGYQLPFGPKGQPSADCDPRMPLLADKGPFFEVTSGRDGNAPDRLRSDFAQGAQILSTAESADELLHQSKGFWRPFNSRNHGGDGQQIGFADGHVDFEPRPIAGINYDNIYTWQAGYRLEDAITGNLPQDKRGPFASTDSVIVP